MVPFPVRTLHGSRQSRVYLPGVCFIFLFFSLPAGCAGRSPCPLSDVPRLWDVSGSGISWIDGLQPLLMRVLTPTTIKAKQGPGWKMMLGICSGCDTAAFFCSASEKEQGKGKG